MKWTLNMNMFLKILKEQIQRHASAMLLNWATMQIHIAIEKHYRLVAIEQHCRDAWCYWWETLQRRGYVICSFKIFRNMFYVYLIKCAHSSKMWHGDYFTVADMFSILLLVTVMFFHTANLWAQSRNKVWRDCRYIIFIGKNLY